MLKPFLLFLINFAVSKSCSNYCKFVWDNTTGNASTVSVPLDGNGLGLTGIVTIDGHTNQDPNNPPKTGYHYASIRLMKDMMHYPIFFTFMVTDDTGENILHVQTSYSQQDSMPPYEITHPFDNHKINIQISDETADSQDYYTLFTNTTGTLNKCDLGSAAIWQKYYTTKNMKMKYTDEIRGGALNGPHIFNYLSVCSDPQPTVCPTNFLTPTLGADLNLTCIGSGAPYLDLSWSTEKTVSMTTHPSTYNTSSPDHVIKSVLTLPNFSLQHEGDYKCTVTNLNFKIGTSRMFSVKYTQPVTVDFLSNDTFLSGTNTMLQWSVTGWPLDTIKLECNDSNTIYNTSIAKDTPSGNFSVSFNTTSNIVSCQFTDSQNASVAMTTVYRSGMNCSEGEYGRGKECLLCPDGQTSLSGSTTCFQGNSSCGEGLYYGKSGCEVCPLYTSSDKGAVKIQECYHVSSTCTTGLYGANVTCVKCPWGTTSSNQTVKIQDCFKPSINCSENFYLTQTITNTTKTAMCVACPKGQISQIGAAKEEDCRPGNSSCPMNFYGIESDCSPCSRGKLSQPNSVKPEDCVMGSSTCGHGSWGTASCELCPWGETSDKNTAVKPQDCYSFPPDKTCPVGQYITTKCVTCTVSCDQCPTNHTSKSGAAKPQDCTEMSSNCSAGYYGYEDRCQSCPDGHTSPGGSKTVDQCVSTKISPQVVFVISVVTVMVLLGLIMVGTFVRFRLKQRRKKSDMRAIFNNSSGGGTLIVKNHFAD
ncbi:hypothetical protein ACHWQZ_G005736 [Mnemiopsis leidyi]